MLKLLADLRERLKADEVALTATSGGISLRASLRAPREIETTYELMCYYTNEELTYIRDEAMLIRRFEEDWARNAVEPWAE